MTSTAPTFRAVDAHTGSVAPGGIVPTIREIDALRNQLEDCRDELHDMRESRDAWADRADAAERALTKFQDQSVRIQELTTELAMYRAGVSAVSR